MHHRRLARAVVWTVAAALALAAVAPAWQGLRHWEPCVSEVTGPSPMAPGDTNIIPGTNPIWARWLPGDPGIEAVIWVAQGSSRMDAFPPGGAQTPGIVFAGSSPNQKDEVSGRWACSKFLICCTNRESVSNPQIDIRVSGRIVNADLTFFTPEFDLQPDPGNPGAGVLGTDFRPIVEAWGDAQWLVTHTYSVQQDGMVDWVDADWPGYLRRRTLVFDSFGENYSASNAIRVGRRGPNGEAVAVAIAHHAVVPISVRGRFFEPETGVVYGSPAGQAGDVVLAGGANDKREPYGWQDGTGGFCVSWAEQVSGYRAMVARFDAFGNRTFGPVDISAGVGGRNWPGLPGGALLPDGRFVVVFDHRIVNPSPPPPDLSTGYYVILNPDLTFSVPPTVFRPQAPTNDMSPGGQSPPNVDVGPSGVAKAAHIETLFEIPVP